MLASASRLLCVYVYGVCARATGTPVLLVLPIWCLCLHVTDVYVCVGGYSDSAWG
jgi:hypothetical protein